MKKQEIYVPIANKKEAKRAKAVLEAMGIPIANGIYFDVNREDYPCVLGFDSSHLDVLLCHSQHRIACRTKITLKRLIELLVSESQQPIEPEKIAVRVDNEKEFNALMKYYDSFGWKSIADREPLETVFAKGCWSLHNEFGHGSKKYMIGIGYKIIPFSEFSKEHGIRVPLLVSEDGVELFEGDEYAHAYFSDLSGKWTLGFSNPKLMPNTQVTTNPSKTKAFSNEKAALDWIEAQKPKTIEHTLYFGGIASVNTDKSEIEIGSIRLSFGDIHDLHTILTAKKS